MRAEGIAMRLLDRMSVTLCIEPDEVRRTIVIWSIGPDLKPQDLELIVLNVLDEQGWQDFANTYAHKFPELFPEGMKAHAGRQEPSSRRRRCSRTSNGAWPTSVRAASGRRLGTRACPQGGQAGPATDKKAVAAAEKARVQRLRRFYLLGQTLEGQQVWDVRCAIRALRSIEGLKDTKLWLQASRTQAANALMASLFEDNITRLDLHELPHSLMPIDFRRHSIAGLRAETLARLPEHAQVSRHPAGRCDGRRAHARGDLRQRQGRVDHTRSRSARSSAGARTRRPACNCAMCRSRNGGDQARKFNLACRDCLRRSRMMREQVSIQEKLEKASKADAQTVLPSGQRCGALPHGARMRDLVLHTDERGTLCEMFDPRWGWHPDPLVFVYYFTIRPGWVKGWAVHLRHEDRYCLLQGEMKLVLWDTRGDSPTFGFINEIYLSEQRRQLREHPRGRVARGPEHRNQGLADRQFSDDSIRPQRTGQVSPADGHGAHSLPVSRRSRRAE